MTTLSAALAAAKPRERSGSKSGARFAFQTHVSLAKVLDAHKAGENYRAFFDYFDDLALSSGPEDKNRIHFYQIKGKEEGSWTIGALTKREGKAPGTIIGKMYLHSKDFADYEMSAIFLTNAPFGFALAAGGKTSASYNAVDLSALAEEELNKIAKALDEDFPPPRKPTEIDIIRFERTKVPVEGFEDTIKGRLVSMFEPTAAVNIGGIYRLLIEMVSSKAQESSVCIDLAEIHSKKSLCRQDIATALATANEPARILQSWHILDDELKESGRSHRDRIKLHTTVMEYVRNISVRDPETVKRQSIIRESIHASQSQIESCSDTLSAASVVRLALNGVTAASDFGMEAAILVETYEAKYAK